MLKAASLARLQPSAKLVTGATTGLFKIKLANAGEAISSTKANAFDVLHKFRTASSVLSQVSALPVTLILSFQRIVA